MTNGEIRYVKGTDQLDELILSNVNVHIEQIDSSCYWICFDTGAPDYDRLVVTIAPRSDVKRRVPLNGYITENSLDIKETR